MYFLAIIGDESLHNWKIEELAEQVSWRLSMLWV